MIRLDVWLTLPDGAALRAGELACGDPDGQGRYPSAFRYTPEYLADPRAFPLDPVGLPLGPGEFTARQLEPPLMVLEDALPDDWGRRLLVLRHGLRRGEQTAPRLLQAQAGQGLGALGFFPPGVMPTRQDAPASLPALPALVDAAQRLEAGAPLDEVPDPGMAALLAAGSSPGGARPKALVHDPSGLWIAKLPSRRDEVDMVGLEAASLHLARLAGLDVPEFRIEPLAGSRRALLVKRFDPTPAGGRRHMLSARALLQAGGYYVLRYGDLMAALRRHSAQPEVDVPALYRQMVFNALLGNTDDHLKNFWLLHDDGYRLTPAFDLLPDTGFRREHVLIFDLSPTPPGPRGLADLGRKWGVSGAAGICQAVADALAGFADVARAWAVPEEDIARFVPDIQRRLTRP